MTKKAGLNKILYIVFVAIIIGVIAYGALIVFKNKNTMVSTFTSDGYAVYLSPNNMKADVLPFKNGETYAYKKYGNKVAFESNDASVSVDDNNIMHYQNGGIVVLKNTVGMDITTIDDDLILYYNIFKNTEVKYDSGNDEYYVETKDKKLSYKRLLVRIDDNKFLLLANDIRLVLYNDQVVDFGKYLYFEYVNGSVVKIYNHEKFYQTVSSDAKIVAGNNTIDLREKIIDKDNKAKITISNLVIDMDANIDVIVEEAAIEKGKINKPNISESDLNGQIVGGDDTGNGGSTGTLDNSGGTDDNNAIAGEDDQNEAGSVNQETETVDQTVYYKEPVFRVTSLAVTALKIDADIEITDDDGLLLSPIIYSIVENATAKTVFENEETEGNLSSYVSYPNLKPDTEYTLYAKGTYKIDDITLEKNFISKIFRTEALGVSFRKSYVTKESIVLDVFREKYSKVSSVTLGIYDETGTLLDYKKVEFTDRNKFQYQITFNELEHNTNYIVKMYDILSAGVVVEDGFSTIQTIKTLKKAPILDGLTYRVNKNESLFELDATKITDEDYGIYNYRYEIFDARSDLTTDNPLLTVEQKKVGKLDVAVDDIRIHRGIAYTYRLVAEFNDNEKNIEYVKELGQVMQLDGVAFPTLRWEETSVTWEQINGSIIIDDPSGTLRSNIYKVVYKNSIDVYTVNTITTETPQNEIPIAVNYLRANETYTFDVYASINLQDGNPTATQTYIGSVNVQTKLPNQLQANFSKNDSYSDVFSITFGLTDASESASFEASTITSMNFTLYQGSTTEGKIEVFKKKIDINDDEYVSTLKQMFYDDSAVIDADFFDADNSEFHQKTYTLVVDAAYDYTGYDSNIIPIINNVYQFDVNNYIPDLPNPDESQITVKQIVNKLSSSFDLDYDNNIDPNTVVGLNVSALYDNNSNSGRYLIYHVWKKNPATSEFEIINDLEKKVYFNEDGTLPSTFIPVLQGTDNSVNDIDAFRRGNEYYLSYEAFLDVDSDGVVDTIYPTSIDDTVILKSDPIKIKKQSSKFKLYPSVSGVDSMTWKYIYSDYDHALAFDKLFGHVNSAANAASSPDITVSDEYQTATFSGLAKGKTLTIKKGEKTIKSSSVAYTTLTSQYFYGYAPSINLSYSVSHGENVIEFEIDNYVNKIAEVDSIASMNILVVPINADDLDRLGTKLLEDVSLRNGKIQIDYFDIIEYYNVDVYLRLIANYDTGEVGFDYTSPMLALQTGTYAEVGNYYTFSGNNLIQVSSIYGRALGITFNPYGNNLVLRGPNNRTLSLEIAIDETGVVYDKNNIVVKNIKENTLTSNNNAIKFNNVIPGISMYNSSNKINIIPLLNGVYVNAVISKYAETVIQDNLIYFELYETDANGVNAQYVDTLSHTIDEFDDSILINNLKHKTNYYIKVYTYVYNNLTGEYEQQYLYDVDQKAVGCIYNFHTLSDVGIKNIRVDFIAQAYNNKRVSVNYELENVMGYDYIQYTVYRDTGNGFENLNLGISNVTNFFKNMHLDISANPSPSNPFVYGGRYKINIKAFGSYILNGERIELSLGEKDAIFTIEECESPYVGISYGKTEGSIYFRVTITDNSHIISNDKYDIQLRDSNGNVVAQQSNIDVSEINRRFTFSDSSYNLVNGEYYTFDVITKNDLMNTKQNLQILHKTKRVQFGSSIDLGTVVLSENNLESNTFNLVFSDSYKLTDIDRISYSVSSVTTGFYVSNTETFTIRYDNNLNLYIYTFNLPDVELNGDNVYLFTFNFYDNTELVSEIEFDYYNGGSDEEGA